jgi:hypothetical protein
LKKKNYGSVERLDKFGVKIDISKKHQIKFNENVQVFVVENWKRYNEIEEYNNEEE